MKIVKLPIVSYDTIDVPTLMVNPLNHFPGEDLIEPVRYTRYRGRSRISNLLIDSEETFELGSKISSLVVDKYEFFGLIPIQRNGNVTEFVIDYFEDGDAQIVY